MTSQFLTDNKSQQRPRKPDFLTDFTDLTYKNLAYCAPKKIYNRILFYPFYRLNRLNFTDGAKKFLRVFS